ncbi:MAG: response regulator transcription factor [Clostridium sp.]
MGIGADDYITKPFSTMVLCAKVKACMRRISLTAPAFNNELIAGPFRYICDEMRLFKNEEEIVLSGKECLMMKYFLSNQNKILNKDQIYSGVWNSTIVDDNTVMVHIRRLRIKIEDDPNQPVYLKNIRGSGYQFVVDE